VFKRLDRLARDTLVQEVLLLELAKAKLVVRSCSPTENGLLDDPDGDPDPMRKFTRVVLSAANELERNLITARTQAAKRRL
ncbi:recombinase family protein, partial [Listeria monocytogenes]|uniref:recombinase family protein n=1 Tax=Listeria monocytogenes TaxID=1639 RepID=UPI002FDC5376